MTTPTQDREFIRQIFPDTLLEEAIEWIRGNLNPEEVFSERDLEVWAENNGFEKE